MSFSEFSTPTTPIHPTFGSVDAERLFTAGGEREVLHFMQPNDVLTLDSNVCRQIDPVYECPVSATVFPSRTLSQLNDKPNFILLNLREQERDQNDKKILGNSRIQPEVEYLLIGHNFNLDQGKGFKGLRRGENVVVDSNNAALSSRFDLRGMESGGFTVLLDKQGILKIVDNGKNDGTLVLNGTQYIGPPPEIPFAFRNKPSNEVTDDPFVASLNEDIRQKLLEVRGVFKEELENSNVGNMAIAGIAGSVRKLREVQLREGEDSPHARQIKRQIFKDTHPDKGQSPAQKVDLEAMFKIADYLLRQVKQ